MALRFPGQGVWCRAPRPARRALSEAGSSSPQLPGLCSAHQGPTHVREALSCVPKAVG